jgi:hypothetical protein
LNLAAAISMDLSQKLHTWYAAAMYRHGYVTVQALSKMSGLTDDQVREWLKENTGDAPKPI